MQNDYKINEKPSNFAYKRDLEQKGKTALTKQTCGKSGFLTVLGATMQKELKKK